MTIYFLECVLILTRDLSNNVVSYLPRQIWWPLEGLRALSLNNNTFGAAHVSKDSFSKSASLVTLNMSNVRLQTIDVNLFSPLASLSSLGIFRHFYFFSLCYYCIDQFDYFFFLFYIDLSRNNLTTLSAFLFSSLVKLERL